MIRMNKYKIAVYELYEGRGCPENCNHLDPWNTELRVHEIRAQDDHVTEAPTPQDAVMTYGSQLEDEESS